MAKKQYKTKEQKKQEIDALTDSCNNAVNEFFKSPEQIKEYLGYMSTFYNYSPRNTTLIQNQFKGAQAVGSFKFWKDQGFSVQKGEKGIKILAPSKYKMFDRETKNGKKPTPLKYASKEEKEAINNGDIAVREHTTFRAGHVFDVSQTNATKEDLPQIFPNKWLEGQLNNYDEMYQSLEKLAGNMNVNIHDEPMDELGVSKGQFIEYTLRNQEDMETHKAVELNPRNSELQNVKTLVHELTHAKLHSSDNEHFHALNHNEKEFQAELTSYTVCSHFGIDTSDYSLQYISDYTKNHDDVHDKMELLNEVKDTSHEFITHLENDLTKEQTKSIKEEFFAAIEAKYGENPFKHNYDEHGDVINEKLEAYQDLMMEHDMLEESSDPAEYTRDQMEIDADPYTNEAEKEDQNNNINNLVDQSNQELTNVENEMKEIMRSGELNVSYSNLELKDKYKDIEIVANGEKKSIGDLSRSEFEDRFTDQHDRNVLNHSSFEGLNNQETVQLFNSMKDKGLTGKKNTVMVDHTLKEPHASIQFSESNLDQDLKPIAKMDKYLAEQNIKSMNSIGYDYTEVHYMIPTDNGVEIKDVGRGVDLGDGDYMSLQELTKNREDLEAVTPNTDLSDIYSPERMTTELATAYNRNLELHAARNPDPVQLEMSNQGVDKMTRFAVDKGYLSSNDTEDIRAKTANDFNDRQEYKEVHNDMVSLQRQYYQYQGTLETENAGELTQEKVTNRLNAENSYQSMKSNMINKNNETNDVVTKMESDAMESYRYDHNKEDVKDNPFGESKSYINKKQKDQGMEM